MKFIILLASLFITSSVYSQIPKSFSLSKHWSKEISLYRAKAFVLKEVLDTTNEVVKFRVSPLAASNSGELTTLIYDCQQQNKFGILLIFYGDYWNDAGVLYQGYGFKQLERNKAITIFKRLSTTIHENYKFINENRDDFNLTYHDGDMTFLIYNTSASSTKVRVFWNGFDAEWDATSLYKTLDKLNNIK